MITYAIAILYAIIEARIDFVRISKHLSIDHRIGWIRRATVFGAAVVLVWATGAAFHLLDILGGAALFSSVFRLVLNYKRGMDLRYCSPSNYYDRLFIAISIGIAYRKMRVVWITFTGRTMFSYFAEDYRNSRYRRWIHRAGLLAYLVEISVSTICILL